MNPWVIRRGDALVVPRVDTLSRYVGLVLSGRIAPDNLRTHADPKFSTHVDPHRHQC